MSGSESSPEFERKLQEIGAKLDADYWEVAGYASHFRADAVTLPATVLHEPEAAK